MGDRPEVSVCVTTRNRAHLLPRLLRALESQTLAASRFEVVVTDDGSVDETSSVLSELAKASTLDVLPLRNDSSQGPGAGRNLAWRAARAPIVAFIDDDCVPTSGWLDAHLLAQGRAEITQGRVEPDRSKQHEPGPFSRQVAVADENGLYETCNICYRKERLLEVDGFDVAFRRSGEDADLAWRAKARGASTTFVPDALVYHDVEPSSWTRSLRDTMRWTGVVRLVERHPHLRSRFGRGRTWRRAHVPAALASAAVMAAGCATCARRPRLALALTIAAAPYALFRLRVEPVGNSRAERAALLIPQLAIDTAEVGVIVATCARLRVGRRVGTVPAFHAVEANAEAKAVSGAAPEQTAEARSA